MKAYIESLGCASNQADTNKIKKYFVANSVQLVSDYKNAEIIVLMSCGFNQIILEENIKRLNEFKQTGAKVYLGGCIPKIKKDVNELVDYSFGPKDLDNLDLIFGFDNKIENFSSEFNEKDKKIIRIATGCEGKCSYCAIKIANGITKSRSLEEIKKDILDGLKEGYSKFVFTSEDNGSWGTDLGFSIIDLINEIDNLEGDFIVTLTTIHPIWFLKYPRLIKALKSKKIEKKIYFPLQSGSNKILDLMKRNYTVEDYKSIFKKLKTEIPKIMIQCDILVGFPTEDEKDFEETLKIVNELDIAFLQVFAYTDMKGTYSDKIIPKVPYPVTVNRTKKVISAFLKKNKLVKNRKLINTNIKDLEGII